MKKLALGLLITTLVQLCTQVSHAQQQAMTKEELQAGICIIANQGVHTVVTERQNGTAKSQTKKMLDNDLKKIRSSFKNTRFVQGIETAWYRALDDIYQMPIQKDTYSKQIFISGITEDAFISCMNNIGNF